MTPKNTEWILPHNQIIITTGSQWEQFSALARMAEWTHNAVEIVSGDTIVFSSSVVPGNDRSVVAIINKLIKLWANVLTKDDWEYHTWWHAFQEEQKIFLNLVKPQYFMPIYGDLYFRTIHAKTAISTWFKKENILLLDNGQIIDFAPKTGRVFKSRIKAPIQEIIIDWYAMSVASSHVLKAREKMMEAWVLVVNFKVDKKTRAIIGHIKIETRGLVYLDEVQHTHRWLIRKSREIYENTIKDVPDIEEKELLKIIKTDLEAYLTKKLDREPMIIPMITSV
jgi:ribonuclease J